MFDPDLPGAMLGAMGPRYDKDAVMWLRQIQDFNAQRDREVGNAWAAIETLYRQGVMGGSWDFQNIQDAGAIQPADVYETIETVEAAVLGNRPKFSAKPAGAKQEQLAKVCYQIMRNLWEMDAKKFRQCRRAVRDIIAKGTGVMRTECISDFDQAARAKKKRDKRARQLLGSPALAAMADRVQQQMSMSEDASPGDEDEVYADTFHQNALIRRDVVSTVHVPIEQFVRDPYNKHPESWTWMGETIICDFDAVVKDKLLYIPKNLRPDTMFSGADMEAGGRIAAGSAGMGSPFARGMQGSQPPGAALRQFLTVHKLFVLSHDEDGCPTWDYYVLTKGAKKPLLYVEAAYDFGCPYTVGQWGERGSMNFPMSDVMRELIHVIEHRDARTRMFEKNNRASANTMLYDLADIPNANELRGVLRGITANYVGLTNRGNKPLSEIFHELTTRGITQEDLAYLELIKQDKRSATGMGNNQSLEAMKSDTSSQEAGIVEEHYKERGTHKVESVTELLSEVAKKELQAVFQFYDTDRIRSMCGPEAAAFWEKQNWTEADIRDVLISVEKGSLSPDTDERVVQKLIQILQLAAADPTKAIMLSLKPGEMIAEIMLREGFPDGSKFLSGIPPEGIDQLIQQVAVAQLQGGAPAKQQGSPPAAKAKSNNPKAAMAGAA